MATAFNVLIGAIGKIFIVFSLLQLASSALAKLTGGIDLFKTAGDNLKKWLEDIPAKLNAMKRAQAALNKEILETEGRLMSATRALDVYFGAGSRTFKQKDLLDRVFGLEGSEVKGQQVVDEAIKIANKLQKALTEELSATSHQHWYRSTSGTVTSQAQRLLGMAGISVDPRAVNAAIKEMGVLLSN